MMTRVIETAMSGHARSAIPSRRQAARIETPTDTATICQRMITRQTLARRTLRALAAPIAAPSP
jgi:hypothetical protein